MRPIDIAMPPELVADSSRVRQAGRRYVPERARITGVAGGAAVSGVTTVSDTSSYGLGLLQTYPMETGTRFQLLDGPEATASKQYEVVYCVEQSGVFRIGARCLDQDRSSPSSAPTPPAEAHCSADRSLSEFEESRLH